MSEPQGDAIQRTLYANEDQSRFFYLPTGQDFPPGKDTLRSLTGSRLDTTLEAAAPYEIPSEEAKELVRVQLTEFMSKASTALGSLGHLVEKFQEASQKAGELDLDARKKERERRVADALGIDEKDATDPSKVMKGLQGLLNGINDKLKNTDDLAKAKARRDVSDEMQKLGEVAVHHAQQDAEDTIAELRNGLSEVFAKPETRQNLRDATERLKKMADQLREVRAQAESARKQDTNNKPEPGHEGAGPLQHPNEPGDE